MQRILEVTCAFNNKTRKVSETEYSSSLVHSIEFRVWYIYVRMFTCDHVGQKCSVWHIQVQGIISCHEK